MPARRFRPAETGNRCDGAAHIPGLCLADAEADSGLRGRSAAMPRAQIKDEKTYQKLREKGESKEKSARIANAAAGSSRRKVGAKGGKSLSYDDWSKADLVKRARELGVKGRSSMSKPQLVNALRNH
jgi:hypothetical protein